MTRRLQSCTRCGGRTRHANHRCASCRRGRAVVYLVRSIANPSAPTRAELADAVPVGFMDRQATR